MKVVVTGAAGRLGVHTCRELANAGHEVTGVDRLCRDSPGAHFVCLDLLDPAAIEQALAGTDAVVHLANHTQPETRNFDPNFSANVAMNFNVFEAARIARVDRLVFASSVQAMTSERGGHDPVVRGMLPWLPLDGSHPAAPTNPYALSKALGEDQLRYVVRNTDTTGVALRFPWLLEKPPPRERPSFKNHRLDEAFTWLTYPDAARLIRCVLTAPLSGMKIYFPAAPRPWLDEEVEILRQRYFPGVPVRTTTPLASFVDYSVITRDTGWMPQDL